MKLLYSIAIAILIAIVSVCSSSNQSRCITGNDTKGLW